MTARPFLAKSTLACIALELQVALCAFPGQLYNQGTDLRHYIMQYCRGDYISDTSSVPESFRAVRSFPKKLISPA